MRRGLGFHARRSPGVFNPASLFLGGTVNGAWYDPSDATTLFSDRAGTTPCGTPGGGSVVPVGAMLDKRAAGYSVFFDGTGDFLSCASSAVFGLGTGNFTVEFWVYPTTLLGQQVIVDFRTTNPQIAPMIYTNGTSLRLFVNNSDVINIASALTVNVWQHVALVKNNNSTQFYINGTASGSAYSDTNNYVSPAPFRIGTYFGQDGVFFAGYLSNVRAVSGTAVYTGAFTPSGPLSPITGTSLLTCGTSWTGNPVITKNGDARVDGLNPFTASPVGNHAIAANDTTARPELRARVNLITYSEEFDNGAWTKNRITLTANSTLAPNNTLTADTATVSTTGNYDTVRRSSAGLVVNTQYVFSVFAKAGATNWLNLRFWDAGVNGINAWFNLATGTTGTVEAGCTASISDQGNGWYRCSITRTVGSSIAFNELDIGVTDGDNTLTGTVGASIIIWGAQLTATNEFPANTYQRISDANTYDAVGFPRYLVANGTSSIMTVPGSASAMKFLHSDVSSVCIAANVGTSTNPNAAYSFFGTNGGATAQIGVWSAYDDQAAGSNNNALRNLTTGGAAGQPVINTADQNSIPPLASNVIFYNSNPANATPASRYTAYVNNGSALATNASGQARSTANSSKDMELFATGDGTPGTALGLMNFYGLIIVNATITGGQRTATQNWIAAKMGVTLP